MIVEKALEYCRNTLKTVSRSFSLTIPLLEKNILIPVLVGYLEARILDNFEDETGNTKLDIKTRQLYLDKVLAIIKNGSHKQMGSEFDDLKTIAASAISNPHYLDLTINMKKVMVVHDTLTKKEKGTIAKWFSEMTFGMKKYLNTPIKTFDQLDDYCYYVGGTVGGLITQLVIENSKQATPQQIRTLQEKNKDFGLFLQKVNITRDFREDMKRNEKIFWPQNAFRENNITPEMALDREHQQEAMNVLDKMISNTRKNVSNTRDYIFAIPDDYAGFKKASSINFLFGLETLNRMENNPDVFYSDTPVKISKQSKERILKNPINELNRIAC